MEEQKISKALLAELIGTYVLVLSIISAVTLYLGIGSQQFVPGVSIPFIALAHGFALFILIQSLGAISGGHFNPAVTLGLLSIRKISAGNAMAYILVQVTGAILAGFTLALVLHDQGAIVKYGSPSINPTVSLASGIALETLFTFLLVWTITATAVNPEGTKEWAPAAIATSLALGVLLIGHWTGASLNPARAFGPDLTNALFGKAGGFGSFQDFILAYVIGPIAGGVLAATIYNATYIKRADAIPPSPAPSEQSPL